MADEQSDVASQICPACGNSIDTGNAEPLQRVDCPNCGEKVQAERMFDNFLVLAAQSEPECRARSRLGL